MRGLITGPDRLSKGETFGVSMKLFGLPYKIRNKVVEFEPDRLIAWRHFGAHRWRYELEPTDAAAPTSPRPGTAPATTRPRSRRCGWLGFPERNRLGIAETLVRLKAAAEADARQAS